MLANDRYNLGGLMSKYFSILAMVLFLPFWPAAASDEGSLFESAKSSDAAASSAVAGTWQTTVIPNKSVEKPGSKPRSVGKRTSNIAALRAEAIQISMQNLPRLRPYASNYPRLVSVVRTYWRDNAANPNARRLTNMILQHIQKKYRGFVRPKLRSGISRGINVLRRKLRNS